MEAKKGTLKLRLLELNHLEQFRHDLLACRAPDEVESKIRWFLDFYQSINAVCSYSQLYWRGRKCHSEEGFGYVSELLAPPAHLAKAGRMNEDNAPVFYASGTANTALCEIGAEPNDFVHIIGLKELKAPRLIAVGEVLNAYHNTSSLSASLTSQLRAVINGLSPEAMRSFVFMDALVAEIFKDPNAVNTGYLHSRLLYRLLKEGTSDVDGIVYPSVAHDGSTNIALSPASASSHLAVDVNLLLRVKKKHSYGIYDSEIVRVAVAEDPDGQIVWE